MKFYLYCFLFAANEDDGESLEINNIRNTICNGHRERSPLNCFHPFLLRLLALLSFHEVQ